MKKYKKHIVFLLIIVVTVFLSLISEGILRTNLPQQDDVFLYVSYIVKNIYVMFNIGIIVYLAKSIYL